MFTAEEVTQLQTEAAEVRKEAIKMATRRERTFRTSAGDCRYSLGPLFPVHAV